MLRLHLGIALACSAFFMGLTNPAAALDLLLPTENTALFESKPQSFFMGVDREGERVWQGGQFGFVRSPLAWPGGTVFTQFHEGIDIAPMHRDAVGIPKDEVRAIASGTVVLAEPRGQSQYGNQLVIRHDWGEGPVFSRYAHLQSVTVQLQEEVKAGQSLGVIGYTGGALPLERAHLHLEIDLLVNESFDRSWLPGQMRISGGGKFHPANMAKLDAAALLLATHNNAKVTLAEFVARQTPYFKVSVAAPKSVDLLRRHPWLGIGRVDAPAWAITFTEWGFPMRFEALESPPPEPQVLWVQPFEGKHTWRTGGLLSGSGPSAVLTPKGALLLQLILGQQPAA